MNNGQSLTTIIANVLRSRTCAEELDREASASLIAFELDREIAAEIGRRLVCGEHTGDGLKLILDFIGDSPIGYEPTAAGAAVAAPAGVSS
jgi:hypothetical protein